MSVEISPGRAWAMTGAVVLAASVWFTVGLVMVSRADGTFASLGGVAVCLAAVLITAALVLELRRGGWTAAAAKQAGAKWPQPTLVAGLLVGDLLSESGGRSSSLVGIVLMIGCATGLLYYTWRIRRRADAPATSGE